MRTKQKALRTKPARNTRRSSSKEQLKRQVSALLELHRGEAFHGADLSGKLRDIAFAAKKGLRVTRVSIWRFSPDRTTLSCVEALGDIRLTGKQLDVQTCPRYLRALEGGIVIVAEDVFKDRRLSELWESYFRPLNVRATLDTPVRAEGQIIGIVCSEILRRPHRWTPLEQSFAASIAEIVAAVFHEERTRLAERALHASEERFYAFMNHSPAMAFMKDAYGRFVYLNPAFAETLSITPTDWLGRFDSEIWPAETAAMIRARDVAVLESGEARIVNEVIPDPRGGERHWLVYTFPFCDASGTQFLGGMGIDFTEEKRARERIEQLTVELERRVSERTAELAAINEQLQNEIIERERAQAILEQSEERIRISERLAAIGTLAAGVAHEINNPLGSILMAADDALEHLDEPERIRAALESIRMDAKRCGKIVRGILRFAKNGGGEKGPCALEEILQRVRDLTRQYAHDAGVEIDLSFVHPLPKISANPTEIEQVFMNIVRNAIEHSHSGGRVNIRAYLGVNGKVTTTVEDFGRGIRREEKGRIFDPFFTTRLDQGGTGLGLSISHRIVLDHGGTIRVESEQGRGTVVTVEFPGVDDTTR